MRPHHTCDVSPGEGTSLPEPPCEFPWPKNLQLQAGHGCVLSQNLKMFWVGRDLEGHLPADQVAQGAAALWSLPNAQQQMLPVEGCAKTASIDTESGESVLMPVTKTKHCCVV